MPALDGMHVRRDRRGSVGRGARTPLADKQIKPSDLLDDPSRHRIGRHRRKIGFAGNSWTAPRRTSPFTMRSPQWTDTAGAAEQQDRLVGRRSVPRLNRRPWPLRLTGPQSFSSGDALPSSPARCRADPGLSDHRRPSCVISPKGPGTEPSAGGIVQQPVVPPGGPHVEHTGRPP